MQNFRRDFSNMLKINKKKKNFCKKDQVAKNDGKNKSCANFSILTLLLGRYEFPKKNFKNPKKKCEFFCKNCELKQKLIFKFVISHLNILKIEFCKKNITF